MFSYISHIVVSIVILLSTVVSSILGYFDQTRIATLPQSATTTLTDRSSEIVPAASFSTPSATAASEGTSSRLALFRTYDITFSYPTQARAVWIDLFSGSHSFDYNYRYPYDPEEDSDVDAEGNYRASKPPSGIVFSFYEDHLSTDGSTIEGYIEKNGPPILPDAKPFHNTWYSGYIVFDDGSGGPGIPTDFAVFYNKSDPNRTVFIMSNSSFFSQADFALIVNLARPTQRYSH